LKTTGNSLAAVPIYNLSSPVTQSIHLHNVCLSICVCVSVCLPICLCPYLFRIWNVGHHKHTDRWMIVKFSCSFICKCAVRSHVQFQILSCYLWPCKVLQSELTFCLVDTCERFTEHKVYLETDGGMYHILFLFKSS